MRQVNSSIGRRVVAVAVLLVPATALAQQSPFDTGANSLVTFALAIATPIAILVVIGAAIAAAVSQAASRAARHISAVARGRVGGEDHPQSR